MAETKLTRPPLNGVKDTDGIGLAKAVTTLQEYYAEDYPVITSRIIKTLNICIGYANGLNTTTTTSET